MGHFKFLFCEGTETIQHKLSVTTSGNPTSVWLFFNLTFSISWIEWYFSYTLLLPMWWEDKVWVGKSLKRKDFQDFKALSMKIRSFWYVTSCISVYKDEHLKGDNVFIFYHEDGSSAFVWNVGTVSVYKLNVDTSPDDSSLQLREGTFCPKSVYYIRTRLRETE